MSFLDRILEHKREELALARARVPAEALAKRAREWRTPARGFRRALERGERPCVIAEIKRRSPSRGEIRPDLDAVACARAYVAGGAAALSILTDAHFFGGSLELLARVREAVTLPLLRKDFVLDSYQIDEARVHGADAVLLIVAALARPALRELREHAVGLGLDALVEVHDERELDAALASGADLIGINNRDLRSFEVDLGVSERLAGKLPEGCIAVAESGIFSARDWERLEAAGARAFLVGEALMREPDVEAALRKLRRHS